jgi:hypothetical protein
MGLAWNGTMWVAGGSGTNTLAYSYDGLTWSASTNGNSIFTTRGRSIASNPAPYLPIPLGNRLLAENGNYINTQSNQRLLVEQ